ncbi:hypothetical protein [Anaerosporobacter faecicola]|uniref:hypothetical protein n=1 Tax=Anaerosporobacter faecicola TaxID=2718714 RepID=UPI00143B8225|nr:hypothetical protein [Anaerosporobacter faecicola]
MRGIKKFLHSIWGKIFFLLIGLVIGVILGAYHIEVAYFPSVLAMMACVLVLGIFMAINFEIDLSRFMIKADKKRQYTQYVYWAIVFLLFALYYNYNYEKFLKTYQRNIFGIDQRQYIFLVNFLIFLIMSIIIYQIIIQQYRIKNIGKGGVELERIVSNDGLAALETNTDMVSSICKQLGALDEIVQYLYHQGYVDDRLPYKEYVGILDRILLPLSEKHDDVVIQAFTKKEYKEYLDHEVTLTTGRVKKIAYELDKYGILKVEDTIHIQYRLAAFHEYTKDPYVYIVVKLGPLYDIKIGELIYAYVKSFEALYSKYVMLILQERGN